MRRLCPPIRLMRLSSLAFACGLLSASLHAQNALRSRTANGEPVYTLSAPVVELPFQYRQHQILVTGRVGTHTGLRFLLDTGATKPVLDAALTLPGPKTAVTVQETGGAGQADALTLDDIGLENGPQTAHAAHLPALQTDLTPFSRALGEHVDGILGIGFLAGYVTEIDYQKQILRLHRAGSFPIRERKPDNVHTFLIPLLAGSGDPSMPCLLINGRVGERLPVTFLLDTGYGGTISITQRLAQLADVLHSDTPRVRVTSSGLSRRFQSEKIRLRTASVGGVALHGVNAQVRELDAPDNAPPAIVGNLFLQRYRVTLDYPNRCLWLEQAAPASETDPDLRPALGITVRRDGNRTVIAACELGSPARSAGLRPGDEIATINAAATAALTLEQVTARLSQPDADTHLVVRHGPDPNFGRQGRWEPYVLRPLAPLDWTPAPLPNYAFSNVRPRPN